MRPKHTRHDQNHKALARTLTCLGFIVIDVADLPGDPKAHPLDLFVLDPIHRRWVQVEVKVTRKSSLTPYEREYMSRFASGEPVIIATCVEDVIEYFQTYCRKPQAVV